MVGWVTALKLVPWGDVIEATPQILQAAKKLLGATRKGKAEATAAGSIADAGTEAALPTDVQLQHLRERVLQLEQEQLDGASAASSAAGAGILASTDWRGSPEPCPGLPIGRAARRCLPCCGRTCRFGVMPRGRAAGTP